VDAFLAFLVEAIQVEEVRELKAGDTGERKR
jgi:hypothetical protein